jgi:hypothetical protein
MLNGLIYIVINFDKMFTNNYTLVNHTCHASLQCAPSWVGFQIGDRMDLVLLKIYLAGYFFVIKNIHQDHRV